MLGGVASVSRVHVPASVDLKPVPDTVTVVPGSHPTAGEPLAGVIVIAAFTVNPTTVAPDVSPPFPEIVRVYSCPGADVETMNVASKRAPVLSITQKGDETSTVAGFDDIEHAPASNTENPVTGVSKRTSVPAGPLAGVVVGMAITFGATVNAAVL
jgi:hypothetical protein